MKAKDHKVQAYFDRTAGEFDAIYDDTHPVLKRFVNKIFRKGMYERVALTIQECGHERKTALDVGCGSGRIALPLAEKGLKVTGIDYAPEMIKLAESYLKEWETKTKTRLPIELVCGDFMEGFNPEELFDIVVALGLFDYIENPVPFLAKMKTLAREKIIAAYPAKYVFQMPIRKLWLWKRGCPVYFYTRKTIKKIYASAGIKHYKILEVPAGYLVIASLACQ